MTRLIDDVHRTARLFRVFFSRRRVAAGSARRRAAALGYPALALLDRDGVYGAPRFHGRQARRDQGDRRRGADGCQRIARARSRLARQCRGSPRPAPIPPHRANRGSSRCPSSSRRATGYRNLCRLVTRDEAAGAERGGRAHARRARRPRRRARRAGGRTAINGPRFGVGGLVDRLVGDLRRVAGLRRAAAASAARRGVRTTRSLRDLASAFHLPVVATNGVRFAEPADRPLYDVLTCIRHKTTLERAGRRLTWNAERYLKPPDAMARLFADLPRGDRRRRASWPIGSATRWPISAIAFPSTRCRRARRWRRSCGRSRRRARASAIGRIDDRARAADRARARSDREARSRRLLPDRLGHRQFLPAAGHPRAGARLGGQQRRLLQPRDHRGRSGRDGSAVRAVPVGGARRVAGHRSRSAERRSPRARDSARLREVRERGSGEGPRSR